MNKTELKALADKRVANIQKLEGYLNAGKTVEEKVVSKVIEQIKKIEETLINEGFELGDKINDDGSISPVNAELNVSDSPTTDNNSTSEIKEVSTTKSKSNSDSKSIDNDVPKTNKKKLVPKKKLREGDIKEVDYAKVGVNLKSSLKDKIDIIAEDNKMKANETVVDLLGKIFDGKDFTVDFDNKDTTKVTSFNIPKEMEKSLTKIKKKTGLTKSEIFNKLIEESLKEFF